MITVSTPTAQLRITPFQITKDSPKRSYVIFYGESILVPMPYGFHSSLAGNSESIQILLKFSVISITSYRQYLSQIKS